MKKKIGLVLLLIAITAGMAFAQKVGDYLRFKQVSNEDDIRVLSVKRTSSGITVEYQALRSISKAGISAYVNLTEKGQFNINKSEDIYAEQRFLKQGKTYTTQIKGDVKFWTASGPITYVTINFLHIPAEKEPGDKPVPKQPKGDWIDRAFPPLKL